MLGTCSAPRIAVISLCLASALVTLQAQGTSAPDCRAVLEKALPADASAAVLARIDKAPEDFRRLLAAAQEEGRADPMLLYLVDKAKALPRATPRPTSSASTGRGSRCRGPATASAPAPSARSRP